MKKVLILCTGNSCRSQIAHGWLNHLAGDKLEVYSAGVEVHGLNQNAIFFMSEGGIDISSHTSNLVAEYENIDFHYLITVCDNANERCPYFPASVLKIHKDFADPSKVEGDEGEIRDAFQTTIGEIGKFCRSFIGEHL